MLEKDAQERDREARERGENPAAKGWEGAPGSAISGSQTVDESNSSGPDQALGGPPQASDVVRGPAPSP